MRSLSPAGPVRCSPFAVPRWAGGFALAEVLVSLGLLAIVTVGAVGVLGSAQAGGMMAGAPTAIAAVRLAKDYTAATVYLEAVQEFITGQSSREALPGVYCVGEGCPQTSPLPVGLADLPAPPSGPGQLNRPRLLIIIERWHWDETVPQGRYCLVGSAACGASLSIDFLTHVSSTLDWDGNGVRRSVTLVRAIP